MSRATRPSASAAGFTLIEVLVAFAIAALLLGAIYQVFSRALVSEDSLEHYRGAELIGQSSLDALEAGPVAAGESRDRVGIYERQTRITAEPQLIAPGTPGRVIPYRIEVSVRWRDGFRQRSVDLTTLWLAPAPQS